ncbi:MAG: tetratricopeptide repeat protein, partial [Rhodobacterales bacterium]|nr:tetratricopeptide repeat protein [Rhodobacterales bacterium]
LGLVALNSGDYQLARGCFEAGLSGNPSSVESKLGLAVALRGLKEYDTAAKLYDQVIEADPGNQKAYFNASDLQSKYTKNFKKAKKILETYVNENNGDGSIDPEHIVYSKIARIDELQEAEEQRKREEEARKKAEQERIARQKQQLAELKTMVAGLQGLVDKYGGCEDFMMGIGDEVSMVVEQANMVIEEEEIDMAGDVITFVEQIQPMAEEIAATCGGGGAPPAEGGDEAPPAEGGEAPPAEGG